MKILSLIALGLLFVTAGFSSSALSENVVSITNSPENAADTNLQSALFSPRNFCRARGGEVRETEQSHISICCYSGKQKCVVTDSTKTISWSVPMMDWKQNISKQLLGKLLH